MRVQSKHLLRAATGALLALLAACGDPTTLAQPEFAARRTLSGTTLVVTNANDAGAGSLRDVIAAAAEGDAITFDQSLSGATIELASMLSVNRSLVIQAPTGGLTLDANGSARVIDFEGAFSRSLLLKGLRLTGASGGGIWARNGSLSLEDCIVEGNQGPSIGGIAMFDGTLSLLRTVVRNNTSRNYGGGVLVEFGATATITNSTISGNTAELAGGGIQASGDVTLIGSTVSGNTARFGGGLASQAALVVIRNSTFSENSAVQDAFNPPFGSNIQNGSGMIIEHSTLVGNSSGPNIEVMQPGIVIRNSILVSPIEVCTTNYGFQVALEGANVISDDSCLLASGPAPIIADAKLAPLAVDGLTAVHRLLAGSPAINASPSCLVNVDQRGAPRPQGGACDLGSVEEPVPLLVTPTSAAAGTINSKTGVILINGNVTCSVDGAVSFNATVEQAQKSGKVNFVLKASTPVQATCVGGAALWSAFTIPASGAFTNGNAKVTLTVSGAGGVTPFTSTTAIRLNWAK